MSRGRRGGVQFGSSLAIHVDFRQRSGRANEADDVRLRSDVLSPLAI